MAKRALVVIDLQNDYFPGGKWSLSGVELAAANAARLIAAFRAAEEPVVHIRHEFATTEAPFFVPGSRGAEIHPVVANRPGEPVVLKHQINSFRDTELKFLLDGWGVEDVIICGAMSHMCVDACTRAAVDFGYKATVIHDACASRDLVFGDTAVPAAHAHAAFMAALGFAYATLLSTDEFLNRAAVAA